MMARQVKKHDEDMSLIEPKNFLYRTGVRGVHMADSDTENVNDENSWEAYELPCHPSILISEASTTDYVLPIPKAVVHKDDAAMYLIDNPSDVGPSSITKSGSGCSHVSSGPDGSNAFPAISTNGQALTTIVACSTYALVSLGYIFLTRKIFSDIFRHPFFISWFQQVTGLVVYLYIATIGSLLQRAGLCDSAKNQVISECGSTGSSSVNRNNEISKLVLPLVAIKWRLLRDMLPLSLSFIGMVGFSNACLKYVQISTYLVARSLTLTFSLLLSLLLLPEDISRGCILACTVITLGFMVGSLDSATLGFFGIVTGILSSFFQALFMVLMKKAIRAVGKDQNVVLFYSLFLASILLLPAPFLFGESGSFAELTLRLAESHFWELLGPIVASGVLALSVTFTSLWCVRVTSPVTFNVLGYAKACVQSLGGIVLLGDLVTPYSATGILLTLGGSFYYSHCKMRESTSSVTTLSGRKSVVEPK